MFRDENPFLGKEEQISENERVKQILIQVLAVLATLGFGIVLMAWGFSMISGVSLMTECEPSIWDVMRCYDYVPRPKTPLELFADYLFPGIVFILGILLTFGPTLGVAILLIRRKRKRIE